MKHNGFTSILSAVIAIVALATYTLDTIYSARNEFNATDLNYIRMAFLAVSAALVILIFVSNALPARLGIIAKALTGVVFATAVFSINWSMVEAIILLPTIAILALLVLAAYLAYIVLNLGSKLQAGVALAALATFTFLHGQDLLGSWFGGPDGVLRAAFSKQNSEFPGIESIEFDSKPNIYLVSFDSIHPKSLTSKYMGIEETPFHEPMYSRLDIFENLFSARVPTKNSMNVMLAMEMSAFKGRSRHHFYNGKRNGRLPAIFRSNGYEINTFYASLYFGSEKGPFVDRYVIGARDKPAETGACEFNDSKFREVSLFGRCAFVKPGTKATRKSKADPLLDFVSFLSSQKKPQFLLASVYLPGHTSKDFLIEDEKAVQAYTEFYLKRSVEARETMNALLDQIEREDPTAIVYLFGDHGPWRSRGDWNKRFKENPEFFVHDRFGILGGLFPKGRCTTYVNRRNEQPYTISIQGAETILKCLTGGRYQELVQEYEINGVKGNVNDISVKFEDYAYE